LDALTISGFFPCVRSILGALGRGLLRFVEHGRDVAGHGEIDMAVQVVPMQGDAAGQTSRPVFLDGAMLFQSVDEVVRIG
jgi:hypothetical protein